MLMCGHNIYRHLDGSCPAPTRTIAQNNQEVENPEFVSWYCQDQLIQNAILASVNPTLAATVAAESTTKKPFSSLIIYTKFDLSVMNSLLLELLMRN
ncbi:hypothetical protein P3L10_019903 [Capsicum annuum]